MPMPDRTEAGLPIIDLEQAQRDAGQVAEQVRRSLAAMVVRLGKGEVPAAEQHLESASAALDWLADRLAIAEGGSLGRVPRSGDDTPT